MPAAFTNLAVCVCVGGGCVASAADEVEIAPPHLPALFL